MGLSWSDLRLLNGSQRDAFEELCSQLARQEVPDGTEFVRKGSPDGGVECYCKLEDGEEWGWQAKFFRTSLGDSQWKQLDGSVKAALDSHPNLVRYFVCIPRNRSDRRRPGVTTELQRWEARVAKWEGWARDREMVVEFVWWGTSELALRLSEDSQAGRFKFWFGTDGQFNTKWFNKHFRRAVEAAGPRYTPEIHVDVPLLEYLQLFGRSEFAISAVHDVAKSIRQTPTYTLRRLVEEDAAGGITAIRGVTLLVDKIVEALYDMRCLPDGKWPFSGIVEEISSALRLLEECEAPLSSAAREFKESNESEETGRANHSNPYSDAASQVRALDRVLMDALDTLRGFNRVVNSDLMIVTGKAGSGKTHLLCDVAERRLADGCPTVVLMGQQFTTRDAPWIQGRDLMDLGALLLEEFVGALEAAAQAADCRALLMVDAINEGEGYAIWPPHLASFLAQLKGSPWIGVVLSVRTPHMEYVISEEVRESACEVSHRGFANNTYAALERFCEFYGLDFPATPLLRPEFDNPLFLKTLCQGLKHREVRRIPVGAEGISKVFDGYISAVNTELATRLDYDPQGRIVAQALDAVARELIEQSTSWLPRKRVQELVDQLAPAGGFRGSLYRALVDTGLLMESYFSNRINDWIVHFGYEWFADYRIANCLIDRYGDAEALATALAIGDVDSGAEEWTPWSAPLEALSVLLPEQLGVELPEILAVRGDGHWVRDSFLKGLPWRDPTTIGPGCLRLVEKQLATAQQSDTLEVFDALITCAMVPGHPLGSTFIDGWLRQLNLPNRDAVWSKYLFFAYGDGGAVDRLLDWGEKQFRYSVAPDDETAAACATLLAWFLTSSHRFVRDRATNCLVALLTDRIDLTCEVVRRFDDVDDLYVRERVMAVAYGVAMRNSDGQALAPLADLVYRSVFAHDEPPVHILLRDYARGVIDRAQRLGAAVTADASLVEPPYRSEWPRIPEADELEALNPRHEDRHSDLSEAQLGQWEIYHSVMEWDFARYVIGTNFTRESNEWLSLFNADPLWKSEAELADEFKKSLPSDLQSAFEELWTNTRPVTHTRLFAGSEAEEGSYQTEESEISFTYDKRHIDPRHEESFVVQISAEQKAAYRTLKASRGSKPPHLDLCIIQSYVLWRVFDLGWTVERFGVLDRIISRSSMSDSGFRASQKPERIGKKYQWIAYHEILGYISDHYQYRVMYEDVKPNNAYRGAWQLLVRDIDPSAVNTATSQNGRETEDLRSWWSHEVGITPFDVVTNEQWLSCDSDVPGPDQHLRFTDPKDRSTWIKLQGADAWQTPTLPGFDRLEVDQREIRLIGRGYFVGTNDVEEFMVWSEKVEFSSNWLPEPPGFHSLFFGEFGWSFAFDAEFAEYLEFHYPLLGRESDARLGCDQLPLSTTRRPAVTTVQ